MVTSTTDFAYAISAMSIREFLRGARGGEIVLSNLEKWQGANWRKEYEAHLKKIVKTPEPVVEPTTIKPEEKLPEGIIIAFAAAPGGQAMDGTGEEKHGAYTKYLLQGMQKSQQIEEVFKQVSRLVTETTNGEQLPWYNSSLSSGSFCFGGCSKTSSNSVKQLALVIGNNDYLQHYLQFAINDAQAIANVLNEKGFEVILQTDLDFSEMTKAIQEFVKRLSVENGVGLFYFSGLGGQIDGKDYLVPVDFKKLSSSSPDSAYFIPVGTSVIVRDCGSDSVECLVSVDHIVEQMQSANSKLNIVILDSARTEISLPEKK